MEVHFWVNDNGKVPVAEFLDGIPAKASSKLVKIFEWIELRGLLLEGSFLRKMVGFHKLWEVRVQFDGVRYRVFVTFKDNICWLLHGFVKKSAKTPRKELLIAEKRRKRI